MIHNKILFSARKSLRFPKSNSLFLKMSKDIVSSTKPILYGDEASPPTRFVLITAKLLDVDIHFHVIDLFKGDHKTEFFKKINPLQKVPALSIDGQTICDSHAIASFLCVRSESHDLYHNDNMKRAKVDQMLYFDATTLFPIDSTILGEYFSGKWPVDEVKVAQWYSAIDYLETQLTGKWLAGNKMQICDICCAMTLSSLGILFPPLERHVKVKEWMKNLDDVPGFEINKRGLERLRFFLRQFGPALDNTE